MDTKDTILYSSGWSMLMSQSGKDMVSGIYGFIIAITTPRYYYTD